MNNLLATQLRFPCSWGAQSVSRPLTLRSHVDASLMSTRSGPTPLSL